MKPADKKKWVAALRSGKYKQGTNWLRYRPEGARKDRYCCLGVACEIFGIKAKSSDEFHSTKYYKYDGEQSELPLKLQERLGIGTCGTLKHPVDPEDDINRTLADLNDCGYTFKEIADIIEKQF